MKNWIICLRVIHRNEFNDIGVVINFCDIHMMVYIMYWIFQHSLSLAVEITLNIYCGPLSTPQVKQ